MALPRERTFVYHPPEAVAASSRAAKPIFNIHRHAAESESWALREQPPSASGRTERVSRHRGRGTDALGGPHAPREPPGPRV